MTGGSATIQYAYDPLGRVVSRSIDGVGRSVTFDALGRVTSGTNVMGTFNYGYLDETGRLTSGTYPNGQVSNFLYYSGTSDPLLKEIKNLDPSSNMISQFDYGYNAVGEITGWQKQNSALSGTRSYAFNYDKADQLTGATLIGVNSTNNAITVNTFMYEYDKGGNRTEDQINSGATISTYNELNQLLTQSPGGPTHFTGQLNKWATVTVGGNTATVTPSVTSSGTSYLFDGVANLATGTNIVAIVATSGTNTTTQNYQVVVPSGTGTVFTHDLNGNMTSDGTNSYVWDAANRLIQISYASSGSSTQFAYNGLGQRVRILELNGTTVTGTKQFVWEPGAAQPSEDRDGSNNVTKRFFGQGEQISGTSYYYTMDHLGSIREMTDGSGTIHARYDYDLFGRLTKVSGDMDSDFAYAGYYNHMPSGLYLTLHRPYNADLDRWLSLDPIAENGGVNLYDYVSNNPISLLDPAGEWGIAFGKMGGPYFNIGWGEPNLLFTPDVGKDTLQGAEAFADGVNPFGDPFASHGFYNKCDNTLTASHAIGTTTRYTELALGAGAAAFWAPGTSIFYSGAGAAEAATGLAEAGEGSTIFDTIGGRLLQSSGVEHRAVWSVASWFYANTSGAEAIVVVGENGGVAGTILGDIEFPVLDARGVNLVLHGVMNTIGL